MAQSNIQAIVLNDLVLINNDRIMGYQRAIDELKPEDSDLKLLFQEKIVQSEKFKIELTNKLTKKGFSVAEGTTNSGKVYRMWMDFKAFFGGSDRKVVLDNCIDGEDAALAAYNDALTTEGLSPHSRSLLTEHMAELKVSYDKIRDLKDKS